MSVLTIAPWCIESGDFEQRSYCESIFSLGNGYMGTRGYRPDQRGRHPAWRATFLAGFYEYIRPGITDIVNQPDFSGMQFQLNGIDSESLLVSDYTQTLNMQNGLLCWTYTLTDEAGRHTRVRQEKLLSMTDRHLAAIRIRLTPIDWSGQASVSGGIDAGIENLPISDDQLAENSAFIKMWSDVRTQPVPHGGILTAQTSHSKRKIVQGYSLHGDGTLATQTEEERIVTTLCTSLTRGDTWSVEKCVAVASYRDGDPEEIVKEKLQYLKGCHFEQLLAESEKAWSAIWSDTDIQIVGNDEWQGAIRYNIFQLIQAMPYGDPHASIGARGLTHGRYKGCYFWDTEIFMLPLFMYTQPAAARNLLEYRYHTLPDAIESARRFSTTGARYSWMSSDTGFEQCESWDTGCCEIHITADIAHAITAYCKQSGDKDFLVHYGTEILIQTARYWVDRFNYSAVEDRYHLLFVKGPDEYCGVTTDDFYTVSLARDNLKAAVETAAWMGETHPHVWASLSEKLKFNPTEFEKWQDIASKVVLTFDQDACLWKQDATFDLLEPLNVLQHKSDDVPLYHKIGFDRLQRYQVLKQPAVLMYMALYPERFSKAEMEAAWNYYEPKTLHDSTLSFGIHALIAARLGKTEAATRYFEKSVFLDLKDVMKNTANEGIHTAALGASWQAMVLGFGGICVRDGVLSAEPHLPKEIQEISCFVHFRGKKYKVIAKKDQQAKIDPV